MSDLILPCCSFSPQQCSLCVSLSRVWRPLPSFPTVFSFVDEGPGPSNVSRLGKLYLLSSVLSTFDSWHSWKWCFRPNEVLHLNKAFLLTLFQDDICFSCNPAALLTHVQSVTSDPLCWTSAWSVLPHLVFFQPLIPKCRVDLSLLKRAPFV